MSVKTIYHKGFKLSEKDILFNYQPELTNKLDGYISDFTQEIVNEIVLWKVNRYAVVKPETLKKINTVHKSEVLDKKLTSEIIEELLNTRGIQLAMASTILRFKNPKVYQIIDQRVYRIIYREDLRITHKKVSEQVKIYIGYLADLREAANQLNIPFEKADRILYMADKRLNKTVSLNNYGSVGNKVK